MRLLKTYTMPQTKTETAALNAKSITVTSIMSLVVAGSRGVQSFSRFISIISKAPFIIQLLRPGKFMIAIMKRACQRIPARNFSLCNLCNYRQL